MLLSDLMTLRIVMIHTKVESVYASFRLQDEHVIQRPGGRIVTSLYKHASAGGGRAGIVVRLLYPECVSPLLVVISEFCRGLLLAVAALGVRGAGERSVQLVQNPKPLF